MRSEFIIPGHHHLRMDVAQMLAGVVIETTTFAIPGIGSMYRKAVSNRPPVDAVHVGSSPVAILRQPGGVD